jgi:hypothetical protein
VSALAVSETVLVAVLRLLVFAAAVAASPAEAKAGTSDTKDTSARQSRTRVIVRNAK